MAVVVAFQEYWPGSTCRESPVRCAEGYRFGNFKPSPETSAVIQKAMRTAGLSTIVEPPAGSRR
jgi:hypothetical protein